MELFGVGMALLLPVLLIVATAAALRISISARRTNQALEQTNQKLDRVVSELRMLRLRQPGEAPTEPSAVAPQLEAPIGAVVVVPAKKAPAELPAVAPRNTAPAPVVEHKPKSPPAEVFGADVKCYYCGRNKPATRYLGQPICADCQKNALLKDEPARR